LSEQDAGNIDYTFNTEDAESFSEDIDVIVSVLGEEVSNSLGVSLSEQD
jgi:hypothetical protein